MSGGERRDAGAVMAFERGPFPRRWTPETPNCAGVPPFQVHRYTPTFITLRQSGCTHFEKPFLFLLLGSREAMLVDTGAGGADVAPIVADVLREHADRERRPELPLLVVHSHGHSDHVAGDAAFRGRPGVRLVEGNEPAVRALLVWPTGQTAWRNTISAIACST